MITCNLCGAQLHTKEHSLVYKTCPCVKRDRRDRRERFMCAITTNSRWNEATWEHIASLADDALDASDALDAPKEEQA